jgi:hypothetical protein
VKIQIVFAGDGPDLTFVEVEDRFGKSIRVGEWVTRADGFHALELDVITTPEMTVNNLYFHYSCSINELAKETLDR